MTKSPFPSLSAAWIGVALLASHAPAASAQPESHSDPHRAVLDLFDDSRLVLLGERHGSRQDSDFRIALVGHPDFASRVDDIVIEFGNSLHQPLLDGYFLELAEVPDAELARVWRDTTSTSGVWDSPIYEEFLRAVRRVNESLPAAERLRVVAGGPPIDWERVEVYADKLPFTNRGWHAVRQIEREVLAKGRKALVIYGYGHFLRLDDEMDEDDNIVRRLEALYPDKSFAVVAPLGAKENEPLDLTELLGERGFPRFLDPSTEPFRGWPAERHFWGAVGELSQFDGLIYFGPEEDEIVRPPEGFYETNPGYAAELERRRGLRPRLDRKSYN